MDTPFNGEQLPMEKDLWWFLYEYSKRKLENITNFCHIVRCNDNNLKRLMVEEGRQNSQKIRENSKNY